MKYGIKFPINGIQFGKSVHVLDLWVYLDIDNSIHYRGYTKPTDAKRYLNPRSFHPKSIFNAIPFSQMLRSLRNNSKEETRTTELNNCVTYFENSGYNTAKLNEIKEKVISSSTTNNEVVNEEVDTLVFPVHYFSDIPEFKKLIKSLTNEFEQLIGNTRIMVATKKRSSIGNVFVRNKQLSITTNNTDNNQQCNGRGCRQCPLSNEENTIIVNNIPVRVPRHLNCKSRHVIYMWLCKLCKWKNEVYFGRTTQECHDRTSGHRGCFNEGKWDKSALSMHAMDVHQTNFSLDIFTVSIVKKVSPQQLRREEFKFIEKYRTIPLGLNRYKV